MTPKLSTYLQTQFGSTQKGLEFLQFSGWLLCLGITLPVMSSVLISPVVALGVGIVFALGIAWLIIIRKKGLAIISSPIDAGMSAIFFAVLVTTYFSIDPSRGMRIVWQWSALILLFYMVLALFRLGFSFLPLVKALLIITSFFVFFGYLELFAWLFNWYVSRGLPLTLPPSIVRVRGLFASPNILGGLLAMMLGLTLVFFIEFKHYRTVWLKGWLITALVMLIITQSMGAWVGLFISVCVYGLSKAWLKTGYVSFSSKVWKNILLAITIGTIILLILLFSVRPNVTFTVETFFSGRLQLWSAAVESWVSHPWLGNGPNSYPTIQMQSIASYSNRQHRAAHNFYLTTLAEMGLVGILATLLLPIQTLWLFWRRQHLWNEWTFVFFIPLIVTAVHMQLDLTWLRTMIMASIFLAGFVASMDAHPVDIIVPPSRFSRLVFGTLIWIFLVIGGVTGWKIVKQYEDGIAKIVNNDWVGASEAFHAGQTFTPYADSLFLYGSGFSDGVLAFVNESYLLSAIENQERLIMLEPGWSVHHANLAGLYRQAGHEDKAIATMQQAIKLDPDAPLYYLNLGLWYEEDGEIEIATSIYRQLYQLPYVWHDSPFWLKSNVAQAIDGVYVPRSPFYPSAEKRLADGDENGANYLFQMIYGYDTLANGHFDDALVVFQELAEQEKSIAEADRANAYLGMGIAQLYMGNMASAVVALEQASILSSGTTTNIIGLWQAVLPIAEDEALSNATIKLQNYYSLNGNEKHSASYTTSIFEQRPIPHDFLPQLFCFTVSSVIGMHMQLVQEWYVLQGDMMSADHIEEVLLGLGGDGFDSCIPLADMPNEGVR